MTGKKSLSSAHRDPCALGGGGACLLSDLALSLIGSSDGHFIANDPVVVAGDLASGYCLEFEADTSGGVLIILLLIVMVVVLALNSGGGLGALSDPDLGASACLLSDVASLALGSGGGSSEASELLVSAVVLSLGANSDKGDEEKFLKHLLLEDLFIIIIIINPSYKLQSSF